MESNQETPAASATSSTTTMINTFMAITSSTQEQAQFFLESHNFDVDAAISTFFESNSTSPPIAVAGSGSGSGSGADFLSPQLSQSPSPSASPSRSRSHSPPSGTRSQYNLRSRRSTNNNNNNDDVDDDNNGRSSNSRSRRARVGGVRTLANLDRNGLGSDSDSDHDRPHPAQRGKVVQDPSKDNDVEAIFEQARRMGAVKGPLDVHQPSSSSRSFTGKARLLSGEVVSSSPQERDPEVIMHIITFWRNGFTVDDGPLRSFDDEDNAPFLESIKRSECPKELEPADRKNSVRVNLVKRDENCPEPQKRRIPFEGVGRTLGTSSPVSSGPSASATALNSAPSPVMGLIVDDKLPSTSIQVRLADGTRMLPRFNYHHTIRDIHAFIDASTPARTGAYTLQMMGFPPKQLTDLDQTIEQAGLANSVVILKFS